MSRIRNPDPNCIRVGSESAFLLDVGSGHLYYGSETLNQYSKDKIDGREHSQYAEDVKKLSKTRL